MSILVANKAYRYFWSLVFGESIKLDIVWDHTANMKFNVFYSTFTRFLRFLTFFILISTFFTSMNSLIAAAGKKW